MTGRRYRHVWGALGHRVTLRRGMFVRGRATRGYLTLNVPNGQGHIPEYVRSVSVRPDARLKLYKR